MKSPDWKAIRKYMENKRDNCFPTLSQTAEKFDIKFQYILARMRKEKWNCPQYKKAIEEKNGRPEINIDKEQFEEALSLWCTQEEITRLFNISTPALYDYIKREYGEEETFLKLSKKYAQNLKVSLKRSMAYNAIEKRNPVMQIFLAKNLIGMSDNPNEQNQNISMTPEQLAQIFTSQIANIPVTDKDGNRIHTSENPQQDEI